MPDRTSNRPLPARPVRVCFVIENLLPAGTELWIVRLIERLDRRHVVPSLCLINGRGAESRALEPNNCDVLRLGLTHLKTPRALHAAWRLYRFLRHQRVDVIQVHHADPSYLGIPVARLARVPVVVQTKYDVGYWLTAADLWMHRRLRRWVDITLANCLACRDAATRQEGAPAASVVVIDNGIDTDRLTQIPALAASAWGQPLQVGMVANLRPVKDPHNLVRAAKLLAGDSLPLVFHLAGDGPLRESLQQAIAQAELHDRFVLHGRVADTCAFVAKLQIFVLCSQSEGLPHALLEAMAAGRAVVATRVGGHAELIEDGVNGLLVPPQDPEALAAALRRLANDPLLAVRLGQAARESIADRFSLPAMAARFTDFYQSLRPGSGGGLANDRRVSRQARRAAATRLETSR
jgi:glycosyltransferase involved in cell wall biosynthesis